MKRLGLHAADQRVDQEIVSGAQQLAATAETLRGLVGRFKVTA